MQLYQIIIRRILKHFKLSKAHPSNERSNCIINPHCHLQHIYLMFDTVHLIKNVRNNLLAHSFEIPHCRLALPEKVHEFPPGSVHWACLHRVHEHDLKECGKLRKAPKINFSVLHPWNNKLSVSLALAIFDPTTTTAISSYHQEEIVTHAFLDLFYSWWLIVNSKQRFHPNSIGKAIIPVDGKLIFLRALADWLEQWKSSQTHGLTNQTFDALILTCRSIADLCDDLFSDGYAYIMTGRFQTDPLERRFSQYRQMSGGRFLISLKEVLKSESIIQVKTILKNSLEPVDYLPNVPFVSSELIEQLVTEIVQNEEFENLILSNDCKEVMVYISGYITHSLLLNVKCKDCSDCLQNNIESSTYVERLNRGGLTIPSQSLNTYLQMAFAVIESIESKVLHSGIPAKILTATLLNRLSTDWESSFSCQSYTQENRKLINCKICNIYFQILQRL